VVSVLLQDRIQKVLGGFAVVFEFTERNDNSAERLAAYSLR